MKPILYFDNISPPVRSVLLLIKALNIDVDYEYINLFKRKNLAEDYIKVNPLHTVPALKFENLILTDSQAILIFLVEKFGKKTNLYPEEINLRSKILNRLFFNSSLLFKRDSDLFHEIFVKQNTTNLDNQFEKIIECYKFLEIFLNENKFMACDHLTIADFSIVSTLSTLNIVSPICKDNYPKLCEWLMNLEKLPYYEESNQKGLEILRERLKLYTKFEIN